MKKLIERLFVTVFVLLPLLLVVGFLLFYSKFYSSPIISSLYSITNIYIKLILPIVFIVMVVHLFFSLFRFFKYKKIKDDINKIVEKKHILWTVVILVILLIQWIASELLIIPI